MLPDGVPRAACAEEDALLRQLIESATRHELEPDEIRGGVMSVSRAGAGEALSLMVAPLLATEVAGGAP